MSGTNDKNFILYLHIAPSGKKYFGITGQKADRRWNGGQGYKNNQHFWKAIQKYGWNNIRHIILADDLTKDDACLFEQILIALYDTMNPNKGYNNSTGGEHGLHSEESKKKMSESHKGKYHSEETKQKMCENSGMRGKTGANNHLSKTVICITTGQVFYGTKEAGRMTGINDKNIAKVCTGKQKSAGKSPDGTRLKWRYVKDLPKPKLTPEQRQYLRDVTNNFRKTA